MAIKHLSFKTTIILLSVMFTVVMTALMVSFSYYSFNSLLTKSLNESTSFNLNMVGESVSKELKPLESLINWSQTSEYLTDYLNITDEKYQLIKLYESNDSEQVQNALRVTEKRLSIQSLTTWNRLQEEFRSNSANTHINRIIIGNHTDDYLQLSSVITTDVTNIPETIRRLPYFYDHLASSQIRWIGLTDNPLSQSEDTLILPIVRPIYKPFSNDLMGWLYLDLQPDLITAAFADYQLAKDSQLYLTINDKVYLYLNGQLVNLSDGLVKELLLTKKHLGHFTLQNSKQSKLNAVSVDLGIDGWYLIQTLSPSEYAQQKKLYYLLLVLIASVAIIIGLSLTLLLNKLVNKPLNKLQKRMALISTGDFSNDQSIEWPNEFGDLGRGINQMTMDIQSLLDKKIEHEKTKSNLQYQILQSQINPHFLYNSLNSIKWMATIQDAPSIAEMTASLSKLLHDATKDTHTIHSLDQELHLLNHYYVIQRYRYAGTIQMDVMVTDDRLRDCLVPKFSLQPIVENAMFHGIEPTMEEGHIDIYVHSDDKDHVIIEISDDGIGMDQAQIATLLQSDPDSHSGFFRKIGINNVNNRIKYSFGSNYGIHIKSSSAGTTMTLTLPQTFDDKTIRY